MDCSLIAEELVAYCFGTCTDPTRLAFENHLLECGDCLRAYLALKRELEIGPAGGERPSPALRERLRADVAARFGRPRVRWFERRIPLYQGLAAASIAAALALVLPSAIDDLRERSNDRSGAVIDTSRSIPESSTIY